MIEREERRVLSLDQYQHGVIVNALNDKRNDLIKEKRPTDIVDEVLLKLLYRIHGGFMLLKGDLN